MSGGSCQARFRYSNPALRFVLGWLLTSVLVFTFFLVAHSALVLLYRETTGFILRITLISISSFLAILLAAFLFVRYCTPSFEHDARKDTAALCCSATMIVITMLCLAFLTVWPLYTELTYCKLRLWEWQEEATLKDVQHSSRYQSVFIFNRSEGTAVPDHFGSASARTYLACAFPLLPTKELSSSSAPSSIYAHVAAICFSLREKADCLSLVNNTKEGDEDDDDCFEKIRLLWEGRMTLDGMVAVKTNILDSLFRMNEVYLAVDSITNHSSPYYYPSSSSSSSLSSTPSSSVSRIQMAESVTTVELFYKAEFEERLEETKVKFLTGIIPLLFVLMVVLPIIGLLFVGLVPPDDGLDHSFEVINKEDKQLKQSQYRHVRDDDGNTDGVELKTFKDEQHYYEDNEEALL